MDTEPADTEEETVAPVGRLTLVNGRVYYRQPDAQNWFEALDGLHLLPGSMLDTRAGRAVVRLESGVFIYVNERTTVRVAAAYLKIEHGELACDTTLATTRITLRTSDGTAVHVGTRFSVEVTPADTTVTVVEGRVKVENEQGAVVVPAGHIVTVSKGKPLAASRKANVAALMAWVQPLRVQQASRAPAAGLLAWWPMDETGGTVAHDASGNGNDAELLRGPAWTPAGRLGAGLQFDGADDWLRARKVSISTNAITLAAWVRHDSLGLKDQCYVAMGDAAFIRHDDPNAGQLNSFVKVGANTEHLRVNNVLIPKRWHHVACTWDGKVHRLYLDGRLLAEQPLQGTLAAATGAEIGSQWGGWSNFMHGVLDDVRIYNRALSAAEIAALAVPGASAQSSGM